jgi:auxin efflux carrier (AEC)
MDYRIIIVSIIVMILIGTLSKKIGLLKENDVETLNNIVINIALPCMIFNALYTADVSLLPRLSILTVYILITSLIVGVLTYLLLKSFGWDKRKIWSMVIVVVLGNTGFLGYPITQGIFGNEGMIRAVFCDISTSIIFVTLSFILILIFDGEIRVALKKIITFLPLWSIVLGILLNIFSVPITSLGSTVVSYLAGATIPLIMISLGLSLNLEGLKNHFKEVGLASIIKLVIYPLIALGVLSLLNITGFEHTIGFIEATMSSAMIGLVLAISYKLDWELTSDCIFTTTLFSLVTIPTFLMFLL